MQFTRITSPRHEMYKKASELYSISFPACEQRLAASQEQILKNRQYQYCLIYEDNIWKGIILYWETECFLYTEHFCILPSQRGNGVASRALERLNSIGKPVILEIDPPKDDQSIRRKEFYERCGYRTNPFSHVHPPYRPENKGHSLVVMSYPDVLNEEEYNVFSEYLKNTVMKACF